MPVHQRYCKMCPLAVGVQGFIQMLLFFLQRFFPALYFEACVPVMELSHTFSMPALLPSLLFNFCKATSVHYSTIKHPLPVSQFRTLNIKIISKS